MVLLDLVYRLEPLDWSLNGARDRGHGKTSTCSISDSFVFPMISFESSGLNTSALFIRGTDLNDRSGRNRKRNEV